MDDQRTNRASRGSLILAFWSLIIISGLPLIVYPAVLLANLMALAAPQAKESIATKLFLYGFVFSTTIYPVVFFVCGAKGWNRAHWGSTNATIFWALAPILYLLIIGALIAVAAAISPQEQINFPTT
jgi:hypothetical protein